MWNELGKDWSNTLIWRNLRSFLVKCIWDARSVKVNQTQTLSTGTRMCSSLSSPQVQSNKYAAGRNPAKKWPLGPTIRKDTRRNPWNDTASQQTRKSTDQCGRLNRMQWLTISAGVFQLLGHSWNNPSWGTALSLCHLLQFRCMLSGFLCCLPVLRSLLVS